MVELVPSSDTLRKIQVEYGVTGSFKDKPLAEWLRKYNPAEDEYEKVKNSKQQLCHYPSEPTVDVCVAQSNLLSCLCGKLAGEI